MKTDGIFTLHKCEVKYKPGQKFDLRPFGDIHRDNPSFAKDTWDDFLKTSKKLGSPLFLGLGDYTDSFSTSERVILNNPELHESTKKNLEFNARKQIEKLYNEIAFMKGNIIGILGGNHYIQFADGTTGDMYLAQLLETKYLGSCTAIKLVFVINETTKSKRVSIDIFAHHGRGGGQTTTGRMNSVEKMQQICEADIFLQGHNHARGVLPIGDKLRLDENNNGLYIRSRRCWIGRTGGFLRGYVNNETSYIVDALMNPTSLGWIDFILEPKRIKNDGQDRMYVEIGAIQ